jgi:hypothetical protein
VLGARLRPGIDATRKGCSAVVVEIVVERTVAGTKSLFLEEERVIQQSQAVEDVKFGLNNISMTIALGTASMAYLLCQD